MDHVNDQNGNGHGQAQLRCDEGLADAAGHQPGVARAMYGDHMKGIDHSGNGSQKPQKGRDGGQHLKGGKESLQTRGLL